MQLLAAIANDAEHMPSLLDALGNGLARPEASDGDVWGIGYYADDRALLIRKPGELLSARNFHELAANVRSQVVIAAVNAIAQAEHAPPFRFRRWLFGCVGDLSALNGMREKITEKLPGFIRSELGSQASELAFAMFLREQHERGLLNDPLATGARLAGSMKRTTKAIAALATEAGIEAPQVAYAATNGRVIIVSRQGPPVYYKTLRGLERLPDGPPDPAMTDFQMVVQALKRFRAVVFAKQVHDPASWSEIREGQTLWVDRHLEVNLG